MRNSAVWSNTWALEMSQLIRQIKGKWWVRINVEVIWGAICSVSRCVAFIVYLCRPPFLQPLGWILASWLWTGYRLCSCLLPYWLPLYLYILETLGRVTVPDFALNMTQALLYYFCFLRHVQQQFNIFSEGFMSLELSPSSATVVFVGVHCQMPLFSFSFFLIYFPIFSVCFPLVFLFFWGGEHHLLFFPLPLEITFIHALFFLSFFTLLPLHWLILISLSFLKKN